MTLHTLHLPDARPCGSGGRFAGWAASALGSTSWLCPFHRNPAPVSSIAVANPPARNRETAICSSPPQALHAPPVAGQFQPLRSNNYRTDCLNPAPSLLYPINAELPPFAEADRKSTRLNSSH